MISIWWWIAVALLGVVCLGPYALFIVMVEKRRRQRERYLASLEEDYPLQQFKREVRELQKDYAKLNARLKKIKARGRARA